MSGPDPDSGAGSGPSADPVIVRRRKLARWADRGQRAGYALFGAAIVLFVVGFVVGFSSGVVTAVVVALVVGSLVLAPAIVVGYAVRAADREDRDRGIPP
jgi:predicted cation transporter